VRVFALGQAPASRFIDMSGKLFDGIVHMDAGFYGSLARMMDEEPALPRDAVMLERLKQLGIEKGRAFAPAATLKSLLGKAAAQTQRDFAAALAELGEPQSAGSHWRVLTPGTAESGFVSADGQVDAKARGLYFYFGWAPPKKLGKASAYVLGAADRTGEPLVGDRLYRLHVPPDVPAAQFWAATVYASETCGFIRKATRVELNSYDASLQKNPDGSVDLYFGSKPPAGHEPNWIYTAPAKRWFALFRLYGPQPALASGAWRLPDLEKQP
jgi:hypothetical protein